MKVKSQQGVALITVIMIVALVSVLGASLMIRDGVDSRRTGNIIHSQQAQQYALGAETLAWRMLKDDGVKGQVDHLGEGWAFTPPVFPVEHGEVGGYITDMQGRFNLNNLVADGQASGADIQRLQRLLRALEIDPALVYPIVDWLDVDNEPLYQSGAETSRYSSLPRPYAAANRLMVSASELRLIDGWQREDVDKLIPFVTALPQRTRININTAPAEVLLTLADGLSLDDAKQIVELAVDKGFASVDDMLAMQLFDNYKSQSGFSDGIKAAYGVNSNFFLVESHALFDTGDVILYTLINRSDNNIMQIIYRARGYY